MTTELSRGGKDEKLTEFGKNGKVKVKTILHPVTVCACSEILLVQAAERKAIVYGTKDDVGGRGAGAMADGHD